MDSNLSGDKLRSPHVSWVFAQLVTFPIFGPGATWVDPLSHGYAVPASRLPPRVLSASGRRPAPTDAAAETGRWATSHRDVAAPKGGAKSRLPLWGRCHAFGMTERATCPRRARALAVRTGAAFSRQSRLPARSVLDGPHWGPGPLGANRQRRHSAGREKRFAVSLAFFYALRA